MTDNKQTLFLISKLNVMGILFLIFGLFCINLPIQGESFVLSPAAEPAYFFHVNMIAPTSNPVRMQYAQLIEKELPKIGISAELDLISWAALGPRVTDQEVGAYADGGYDISFYGMSMGTPTTHQGDNINGVFGENSIPPYGYNVMYWSEETGKGYNNYLANESETLIQKINNNLNMTETAADFVEWQKIWYDAMPMLVLYNQYEVHAISKGMYGYDPNPGYPATTSLENIWLTSDYTGEANNIVIAASTGATTFNSLITTDVYSDYANGPTMDTLYGLTAPQETVLPTTGWGSNRTDWMLDVYGTTLHSVQYPRMAAAMGGYTASGPKKDLEYNVTVRDDVLWHDGHVFDAWDVAFTFQAVLTPLVGCPEYSSFLIPFGNDDKANLHGRYSFIVEDKNIDGHYEHISFQLNQTYAPLELHYIGGYPILPEHILGDPVNHGFQPDGTFDPNLWVCKPLDWYAHSFNTGRTSDPGGLTGPIGTGSMVFKSFNPTTSEVSFEKFEDIWWDGDSWEFNPSSDHYLVASGRLENMTDTVTIIVASLNGGLADMKVGDVNVLDPQFTMSSIWEELLAEAATINAFCVIDTGWQALFFNPKFQQDGVYHLQKKGVRHAISHLIRREDIVEYLLNGLGVPAHTPMPYTAQLAGLSATISQADMVAYKKTLQATDGSTPLAGATTAHDKYSLALAFDWLDTEAYDTSAWRAYTPPAPPVVAVDEILFHESVKETVTFSWTIETLQTAGSQTNWDWPWANNFNLEQGQTIELTWSADPPTQIVNSLAGPVDYTNMVTTIGGIELDATADETWFNFFIIPLYVKNDLGEVEDMRAYERLFSTSAILPNSGQPYVQGYTWQIDITNASLHNTGVNGIPGTIILAHIHTHDYFDTLYPESYVFDVAYDAVTGIVQWVKYPSEATGQKLADNSDPLVLGLDELKITFGVITIPTTPSSPLNLQTTAGDNQVSLVWDAPSDDGNSSITEYYVYRGSTSGGPYNKIGSTPMLGFIDTTAVNGNTYYYVVTALNAIGESDYSNEASATPSSVTTTTTTTTTTTEEDKSSEQPEWVPGWPFTLILAMLFVMGIKRNRKA